VAITADTLRQVQALRSAVGAEADTAVRGLTTAWVNGWTDLTPRWRAALADVLALQAELQRWPSPWDLSRLDRLQRALQATEQTLTLLGTQAGADIAAASLNAVDATAEREPHILASQLPPAAVATGAVLFAGLVSAHVLAVDRQRAVRQAARYVAPLAAAGLDAVHRVLLRNRSTSTVVGLLGDVEVGFNTALGSAISTARTEPVDASRAAARTVHLANTASLRGWSWHCRCSLTSCVACWAMDGTEYPADVPGPDGHISCSCQRLPILRSWHSLGYTQVEPDSVIQPARDRFDALPEVDQLAIMGAARLELLRSGKVGWTDLATRRESRQWRASYVPTPLRDLQRLAARQPV
jgi:hypothetical protein